VCACEREREHRNAPEWARAYGTNRGADRGESNRWGVGRNEHENKKKICTAQCVVPLEKKTLKQT